MYKHIYWPQWSTTKEEQLRVSKLNSILLPCTCIIQLKPVIFKSVDVYDSPLHAYTLSHTVQQLHLSPGAVSTSNSYFKGIDVHICTLFTISQRHFIVETLFCTLYLVLNHWTHRLLQNSNRVCCVSIWHIVSVWLGQPL